MGYRQAVCHYMSLNQELTLNANDLPDPADLQEFLVETSDASSTTDDEVSSSYGDFRNTHNLTLTLSFLAGIVAMNAALRTWSLSYYSDLQPKAHLCTFVFC